METEPERPPDLDSREDWARLIDRVNLAYVLLAIERRLSPAMRRRHTPEDILQETLLAAWRDRGQLEWRGFASFRSFLMRIAENRIRDLAEADGAQKRRHDALSVPLSVLSASSSDASLDPQLAWITTTPGRLAAVREQVERVRAELARLPDEQREVLVLRLIEEWEVERIATHLSIGIGAAKHRYRTGASLLQARLRSALRSSSRA